MSIVATEIQWIPELSRFLLEGFPSPPAYTRDFGDPAVLRWKFFDPRGKWSGARSFVVRENDRLVGHIGICPTEFCSTDSNAKAVPTFVSADWLVSGAGSGQGGLLMLTAFGQAPTQYTVGASPSATRVLFGMGFKEICAIPVFQKVLSWTRLKSWREIHGEQNWWRHAALFAVDLAQSLRVPNNATGRSILTARRITEFGDEVLQVIQRCRLPITFTSRDPSLLNHYLRYPKPGISGWLLEINGQVRGFAVLSVINKRFARLGRIAECFLDTSDAEAWSTAIGCLEARLTEQGCEILSCFGSTPWMMAALRNNGFFRRGRVPFHLRDPHGQIRTDGPLHITQLEGDAAYN